MSIGLNIHTERTEGNWINNIGQACEIWLVRFSRQLSRQKGGKREGLGLGADVGRAAGVWSSQGRPVFGLSTHQCRLSGKCLLSLQRESEAREKGVVSLVS